MMNSDRNYIVGFSFLVLVAFLVLVGVLRDLVPSSQDVVSGPMSGEQTGLERSLVSSGTSGEPPDVLGSDPVLGPGNAPVTIVVFGDFECVFCKQAHDIVVDIQQQYPNGVRLVWKDFPLPIHASARKLAFAARCAKEQGRFWEFADSAFQALESRIENQESSEGGLSGSIAKEINLNLPKFQQCVEEDRYVQEVGESIEQGIRADIGGVPFLFVNNQVIDGLPTKEQLESLIQTELNK